MRWKNLMLRTAFIALTSAGVWQPLNAIAASDTSLARLSMPREGKIEDILNIDERKLIQESLIWDGSYQGMVDGHFDENTRAAIASSQQKHKWPATGVLDDGFTRYLANLALTQRKAFGWTRGTEPKTGAALAYPSSLLTVLNTPEANTANLNAEDNSISLRIERIENVKPDQIDTFYNNLSNDTKSTISYNFKSEHSFITAGTRGPLKFSRRYEQRGNEIRTFDLVWLGERDADMKAIAVLMTNSFDAFNNSSAQTQPEFPYLSRLLVPLDNDSSKRY